MWFWIPILIGLSVIYGVSYTLVRTSGDGRSACQRLVHPSKGGLQEEYGGVGQGRVAGDEPPAVQGRKVA